MNNSHKKIIWHVVRIVVAVGSIAYVVAQIEFDHLVGTLRESSVACLVGALVLLAFQPVIGALRWRRLLRVQGVHLKFMESLRLTYIGLFFNNWMPSSVGGDAVKAYYIATQSHRKTESVVSILVDRIVGIGGLIILGTVAAVITIRNPDLRLAHLIIGAAFVAFFGPLALFYSRHLHQISAIGRFVKRLPFISLLRKVDRAFFVYRFHKKTILAALLYTWLTQLVGITVIWMIGRALGRPTPFHLYLLYMPVIWLVWVLPISISGLGTVEAAFQYFFTAAVLGVTTAQAPAVALAMIVLFRMALFAVSLPGGLIYIFRRTGVTPKQMRQEIADIPLPETADDE